MVRRPSPDWHRSTGHRASGRATGRSVHPWPCQAPWTGCRTEYQLWSWWSSLTSHERLYTMPLEKQWGIGAMSVKGLFSLVYGLRRDGFETVAPGQLRLLMAMIWHEHYEKLPATYRDLASKCGIVSPNGV